MALAFFLCHKSKAGRRIVSLRDYLPKVVGDAMYEEELPKVPVPAPRPMSVPTGSLGPRISYQMPSTSAAVVSSAVSAILSDLRAKTNFDATPIGQQVKESMDALADTGLSDEQKVKTAMKLSHQSPAQVISVLQGLQAALLADKQHFEATMQTATTAEVNAREAKSAQLQSSIDAAESQLNAMRQEKAQVDMDSQQKKDKIASARTNYVAAFEARNTEIMEMISHYQSVPAEVK
jgi:hypothetical protein